MAESPTVTDGAASEKVDEEEAGEEKSVVYTVDDAVNKMGFGFFQVLITVFCGLLWLTEAMEFMLLSVLSPAVKCQWDLSSSEEALITSVVFLGFFIGGFTLGGLIDYVGRKRGLFVVNLAIIVFGVLSAIQVSSDDRKFPGYPWLLVCRFGLGVGAGGSGQAITYYVEFLPRKGRGICMVLLDVWWALGGMLGAALSIGVMREGGLGWHWLLGLSAIPLALVMFMFPLVPESARFYLVKGKKDKAEKVIKRIAWLNCKPVPPGRLVLQEEKDQLTTSHDVVLYKQETVTILSEKELSNHASYDVANAQDEVKTATLDDTIASAPVEAVIEAQDSTQEDEKLDDAQNLETDETPLLTDDSDTDIVRSPIVQSLRTLLFKVSALFRDGMWRTTVLLQFLWFGSAWLYYGIILLTTSLLQYDPHCGVVNETNSTCEESQLDTGDYLKIMWAAAAELPGIAVTLLVVDFLGRKWTMAIEFVASMVGFLLLFVCTSDIVLTFFLFFIRAFTTGAFQVVYIYTPEVYPTHNRALGVGLCQSSARIGAMMTPYVAQVLLHFNDYFTISLYAASSLGIAALALMLPVETKGRSLKDRG